MTLRDKIMDKYWDEFIVSDAFQDCTYTYEYARPLEATFWKWFKITHLKNQLPKSLEEFAV